MPQWAFSKTSNSSSTELGRQTGDSQSESNVGRQLKHIDIEVTKKCNLSCIHCSAQSNIIGNELTSREIKTILDHAFSLGVKKIGFTGGEPLARRNKLVALLRYCERTLDSQTHLHTNATLLGVRDSALIAGLVDEVTITFLGSDSRTHDAITTVEGSLKAAEEGLRSLLRAHANLRVFVVPMKPNFQQIPQIIRKVHETGCQKFRVLSLSPTGRARKNFQDLSLNANEIEWLSSQLIETRDELGVDVDAGFCTQQDYPSLGILQGHQSCLAAEDRIHVNAFGDVFPCTAASGWGSFSAGNLRDHGLDPLEIWKSSPILQFIRFYHSNPSGRCRSCATFARCMGGCRVVMYYKYGDITVAKPYCRLGKSSSPLPS